MYPRNRACFRSIMVNTLHKGRKMMIILIILIIISRDSSVGRATIIQTGRSVVRIAVRVRFFTSPKRPDQQWGTPSFVFRGTTVLFHGGWDVDTMKTGRCVKLCGGTECVRISQKFAVRFFLPVNTTFLSQ